MSSILPLISRLVDTNLLMLVLHHVQASKSEPTEFKHFEEESWVIGRRLMSSFHIILKWWWVQFERVSQTYCSFLMEIIYSLCQIMQYSRHTIAEVVVRRRNKSNNPWIDSLLTGNRMIDDHLQAKQIRFCWQRTLPTHPDINITEIVRFGQGIKNFCEKLCIFFLE